MIASKGREKNNCPPRIIRQKMLSFKNQSEIKISSEKQKLRELTANRHSLKKCLRRCFRRKENDSREEGLKSKTEE